MAGRPPTSPRKRAELGSVELSTRAAWRAWLGRHHATSPGVWLVTFRKATGRPTIGYDAAVEEALCVGWIDSTSKRLDAERHAQRFGPRRDPTTWSATNLERMERLLREKKVMPAGLAVFRPAPLAPRPRTRPSAEAPPDLQAALQRSTAASHAWADLAPGYRRGFVGWILEAQRPETRAARVASTVERVARGKKAPFG